MLGWLTLAPDISLSHSAEVGEKPRNRWGKYKKRNDEWP